MAKSVWYFENQIWSDVTGGDASETGSGPGSYNIKVSVWHVNCCNPELNGGGGWGIFNAILGWTNSATQGSVISYNLYWLCVMVAFACMRFYEKKGHWPFLKAKASPETDAGEESGSDGTLDETAAEKKKAEEHAPAAVTTVRELRE
jgi:high-affinity iron transporter